MSNLPHIRSTYSGEEVAMELDDTQTLRALTAEGHLPPLLILSRDTALIDTVRKAAPTGMSIRDAATIDAIADKLAELEPGILLVDGAGTSDIAGMLSQLTQHFPEMVAVVAGRREDSGALLRLTAEGRVFRFLLTPLSHGQTRLALKAAAAQHIDIKASGARRAAAAEPAKPARNYIATYGALGAGLLVVLAGVWFGIGRLTIESQPTAVSPQIADRSLSLPQRIDPVSAELALAKEAFDAGRYLEPRGESALDFYRSALALDPSSESAKLGVRSVADKILERAETALTAERLEEAVRNLETARDIDPTHSRLAFLDVQVARERERMKLTQARGVDQRVRGLVPQSQEHMRNERLADASRATAPSTVESAARSALPVQARSVEPPGADSRQRVAESKLTESDARAIGAASERDAIANVEAARQAPPAPSVGAQEPSLMQATSLHRTREVAAEYPRQALMSGIEGWVDLDFTISPDGIPGHITVRNSRPRRTFDRAATEALRMWRFEPIVRDGAPIEQRATLRMTFKPGR
jgi:TonB family protein